MTDETMPSDVTPRVGFFDRFAEVSSRVVARSPYFFFSVALIVLWAVSYPLWPDFNTYQLIINSVTTVLTFLMVSLLQNSQHRSDKATQQKLNAISAALADLMADLMREDGVPQTDVDELTQAVGLEHRESS